jgi:hypothetical protein
MQTSTDQELLTAITIYTKSTGSSITQAQADLSNHKSVNAISVDITSIASDAATLGAAQDSAVSSAPSTLQRLSPQSTLQALMASLKNLKSSNANK